MQEPLLSGACTAFVQIAAFFTLCYTSDHRSLHDKRPRFHPRRGVYGLFPCIRREAAAVVGQLFRVYDASMLRGCGPGKHQRL